MDSLRPNGDAARLEPGTVIANYVVEELLGHGTEGCVYVARDSLLGRQVALKTLRVVEVGETRGVEEARMLAGLEHPNVVRVFHARRHHGIWYVVFEYLAGGSLQGLLDRAGPLAPEQALDLTSQAAAGLAYVHAQSILHRDIKPHNLLLSRDGNIKLCDFGLALDLRGPRRAQSLLVGTPAFLAPELWTGGVASTASDVFSLGVCLFHLLCGRLPFVGSTTEQLVQAQAELTPKFPADLPPPVVDVVASMLSKDPAARPTSQELPELLQQLALEPYRSQRSTAPRSIATETPFGPEGPERAAREALRRGRACSHVAELTRALDSGPSLQLCSANPSDAQLLLDVVLADAPERLLAKFLLLKPQLTLCQVIEHKLGLRATGSLAQACEHLADPARRRAAASLVALHAPRGVTAAQSAELEFVSNTLAPHGVRCVVTTPLPSSDEGQTSLPRLPRLRLFDADEDPREIEQRLELWLQLATAGRFHFSRDGLRLAAHSVLRDRRFWVGLGLHSLLIAAASRTRIVASWAVARAREQTAAWHVPSDVPAALSKRPLCWPSRGGAQQLRDLSSSPPLAV